MIALPSPSCPAQLPNWCPPYLWAYGSIPSIITFPHSKDASSLSNSSSLAISSDQSLRTGSGMGSGLTLLQQAPVTCLGLPPITSSPGVSPRKLLLHFNELSVLSAMLCVLHRLIEVVCLQVLISFVLNSK